MKPDRTSLIDRAMNKTLSQAAVAALSVVSALASAAPGEVAEIITDAQKASVGSVVRASISVPSLAGHDLTVFAPSGTQLWFDTDGTCALSGQVHRMVVITSAELDRRLCWRAEEEVTARLMARITAQNAPTKWFSGPAVEFRNRWFNPSFWAGVLTTLLTGILTLFGAFGQQMFSEWRERKKALRDADAEAKKHRSETRFEAQRFLAQEFFPGISNWRQTLDQWRPDSGASPPNLGLASTYAGTKPERAETLATYFAEVNRVSLVEGLKELHVLGTKYNKLAASLNVPTPEEEVERQELERIRYDAVETADRLRAKLKELGF